MLSILSLPLALHPVVHLDGGGLVDRDHHRLALMAPADEVIDEVVGDGVEPVVVGDQVVLAGELPGEALLLVLVELGLLEDLFHVVVEVRVDQLHLGRAVLVVERHRRPVLDRLAEVVDRHVVAEHLPGPLLPGDQRRPGEGQERCVRQGVAQVQRQRVVLGAVRLVGDHDDVVPLRQHRIGLARSRCGTSGST